MTIKELENRTGMARANIRFYENEGLLAPKRLDNGYRDYSEEDARTLEKIKLLRQLQLDIDTIRKVQSGALTLEQALFSQTTKLEGDKAVLERAAQVCRELERSGVEYAALEPQPWLAQLQAPPQPNLPQRPPAAPAENEGRRDDEPRACYCPWQRYFARTLDMWLYDTLINVLWFAVLHDLSLWRLQTETAFGRFMCGLALLVLSLALEPLWLHFAGWTPGKWLFGLKLRDEGGDKLTLAQAWERSWRVFQDGYGWNIPLWDLWRMWKCRELGVDGRDCWWDAEEGYRYTKAERKLSVAVVVYVLAAVLLFNGQMAAKRWADLPLHRGGLTVAEFSENYNQYHRRVYTDDNLVPRMNRDGTWNEAYSPSVGVSYEYFGSGGELTEYVTGTTRWEEPEFTLTDGRVAAVTVHMETRNGMLWPSTDRETLLMLALAGSVDGLNVFDFDLADWLTDAYFDGFDSIWENIEADYQGLHISWRINYQGYDREEDYAPVVVLVRNDEGKQYHLEKSVTISLVE